MQPLRSSGSCELNRSDGGLARFWSAPATWLEALLEFEDEKLLEVVVDAPKPPLPNAFAPASAADLEFLESTGGGEFSSFLRMNNSPAEFLSLLNNSEAYYSNLGIPTSYDYGLGTTGKRPREAEDLDRLPQKGTSTHVLASVITVLGDSYRVNAMIKSKNLINGKLVVAIVIFFKLSFSLVMIDTYFRFIVVYQWRQLGILKIIGIGSLFLSLLLKLVLFVLVVLTVIYFVCKSYHHKNIDKSALSEHLEVYLGEYVPLKAKDVHLEVCRV